MHKGSRIENPRRLAAAFACCVTAEANGSTECVAKNSDYGLFKVLHRMLPEVGSLQFLLASIMCLRRVTHVLNTARTA